MQTGYTEKKAAGVKPRLGISFVEFLCFIVELLNTLLAYLLSVVLDNVVKTLTENAGRRVLAKNDFVIVYKNFKCVG